MDRCGQQQAGHQCLQPASIRQQRLYLPAENRLWGSPTGTWQPADLQTCRPADLQTCRKEKGLPVASVEPAAPGSAGAAAVALLRRTWPLAFQIIPRSLNPPSSAPDAARYSASGFVTSRGTSPVSRAAMKLKAASTSSVGISGCNPGFACNRLSSLPSASKSSR